METNISNMAKDISDIKKSLQIVADELPCKADKKEVDEKFTNITKANKLQSILTNVLVSVFSIFLTLLINFWFNNK